MLLTVCPEGAKLCRVVIANRRYAIARARVLVKVEALCLPLCLLSFLPHTTLTSLTRPGSVIGVGSDCPILRLLVYTAYAEVVLSHILLPHHHLRGPPAAGDDEVGATS